MYAEVFSNKFQHSVYFYFIETYSTPTTQTTTLVREMTYDADGNLIASTERVDTDDELSRV